MHRARDAVSVQPAVRSRLSLGDPPPRGGGPPPCELEDEALHRRGCRPHPPTTTSSSILSMTAALQFSKNSIKSQNEQQINDNVIDNSYVSRLSSVNSKIYAGRNLKGAVGGPRGSHPGEVVAMPPPGGCARGGGQWAGTHGPPGRSSHAVLAPAGGRRRPSAAPQ